MNYADSSFFLANFAFNTYFYLNYYAMNTELLINICGWIATFGLIFGYLPQAIQTIRTRNTDGISLPGFISMAVGCAAFVVLNFNVSARSFCAKCICLNFFCSCISSRIQKLNNCVIN